MGLNQKFWKDKKVLITGHTGFKGAWLTLWLNQLGANVYGYSLEPVSSPNLFNILKLENKIDSYIGDIRNYAYFKEKISQIKPEILIHMAAQPLVRESYLNPINTYETNIMGTVNVLDICRNISSIKSILIITSDKCYDNIESTHSYIETDSLGGYDPYSSSKGCADIITSAYYKSFYSTTGVGVAIARAGNVIGGGDWSKDRILPDAMKAFSSNKNLVIRNPQSIRPWQFVLDPLYGYLLLIENIFKSAKKYSEPWNFGPKEETAKSVEYICNKLVSFWEKNASWSSQSDNKLHEANLLLLNSNKSKKNLKWESKYDLNHTLKQTVVWYNNYYSKKVNIQEFSLKQINDYLKFK